MEMFRWPVSVSVRPAMTAKKRGLVRLLSDFEGISKSIQPTLVSFACPKYLNAFVASKQCQRRQQIDFPVAVRAVLTARWFGSMTTSSYPRTYTPSRSVW